jgi:hypothetical protein
LQQINNKKKMTTIRLQRYLDKKTPANWVKLSTAEQNQLINDGDAPEGIKAEPKKKKAEKNPLSKDAR